MTKSVLLATFVLLTVPIANSAEEIAPEKDQEFLLAVYHIKSTDRFLVVNSQMQVSIFNAKSKRVERTFAAPPRKPNSPYKWFVGSEEKNYQIQLSEDGRRLVAVYEPKGNEEYLSSIAFIAVVWDCQTGRIVRSSEIPRDKHFLQHVKSEFHLLVNER
ncbi:MAG: hypothetical protein KDA84_29200, partial [Planctomycetaceae bacterium]|nr:hypothetical protein [Planctomycetaceae bacterium]